MARLETVDTFKTSGYSLTVLREGDDFATFDEDILVEMRAGAESRMARAVEYVVRATQWTLSAVYPGLGASGEHRQPAPSGEPPGHIGSMDDGPDLRDSWKPGKVSWGKKMTVLTGRYFSRHRAAGRLEYGDASTGKGFVLHLSRAAGQAVGGGIPPHPYIRPTLIREADAITRILDGTD